jgi:hypothetical protein
MLSRMICAIKLCFKDHKGCPVQNTDLENAGQGFAKKTLTKYFLLDQKQQKKYNLVTFCASVILFNLTSDFITYCTHTSNTCDPDGYTTLLVNKLLGSLVNPLDVFFKLFSPTLQFLLPGKPQT